MGLILQRRYVRAKTTLKASSWCEPKINKP
jgi:hypothetical protein